MSSEFMGAFLRSFIPDLMDIGWDRSRIDRLTEATKARMGQGGTTRQWLSAMAAEIASTGDRRAADAFLKALKRADAAT